MIKFLMACFQRQRRRRQIIEKYLLNRDILDVGAGEGYFAKILKDKFMVTSLEAPFAKIKNKDIDFAASQDYDSVLFGAPKLIRNLTLSQKRKINGGRTVFTFLEFVELEKVYRQTDEKFINLLNAIRNKSVTDSDLIQRVPLVFD